MAPLTKRRLVLRAAAVAAGILIMLFLSALAARLSERDRTVIAAIQTAHVRHILGPQDIDSLGGNIAPDFGVSAEHAVVFSAGGALRVVQDVDAASPLPADVEVQGEQPQTIALDPDGSMLGIAGGYFGALARNGQVTQSVPMPFNDMRLAPSVHSGAVYLFGGSGQNSRAYRFLDDGSLQILLQSDQPIVAVADNQSGIFAATASRILEVRAGRPKVLFTAPQQGFDGPIRSLAVTDDGVVIFSTDGRVYALLGPNALSIVNNSGGSLRLRDGVLYVLDPTRRMLFSMAPASQQLFSGAVL